MVNLPFSGHTNPTLGLAKVLVDLGHHVSYINAPDWKKKLKEPALHLFHTIITRKHFLPLKRKSKAGLLPTKLSRG